MGDTILQPKNKLGFQILHSQEDSTVHCCTRTVKGRQFYVVPGSHHLRFKQFSNLCQEFETGVTVTNRLTGHAALRISLSVTLFSALEISDRNRAQALNLVGISTRKYLHLGRTVCQACLRTFHSPFVTRKDSNVHITQT